MDEEIEVLEPNITWEKEIPELAEVVSMEVPVQEMIINGQRQVISDTAHVLCCPKCKTIIQQFQPGISRAEVLQALTAENERELKRFFHCSKCGTKIQIMRPAPVEADSTIVEVQEPDVLN